MTRTPETSNPSPPDQSTAQTGAVLVLGEGGGLGAALLRRLETSGQSASSALDLSDGEASEMLREGHWRAVAVVTRDDAQALRLALLSAHVRPDLPLWVTMFDHTVSRELEHVAPKVHVLSPSSSSRSSPRPWSAGSTAVGSPPCSGRAPRPPATTSCWSASGRSASASPRR